MTPATAKLVSAVVAFLIIVTAYKMQLPADAMLFVGSIAGALVGKEHLRSVKAKL